MPKKQKTVTSQTIFTCCVTGEKVAAEKLPFGWKRLTGKTYSPEGYEQRFCPRGITIQVASVEVETPRDASRKLRKEIEEVPAWSIFTRSLNTSFKQAMQVSNWTIFRLAGMEPFRPKSSTSATLKQKLPKHPIRQKNVKNQLCAELREAFPDLDSQSLYVYSNQAVAGYTGARFKALILGTESIKNFRFPLPLHIPAATFAGYSKPWILDGDRLGMSLRIAGLRFTVWLCDNRKDWGEQIELFRKCAKGELQHGAILIRRNRKKQVMLTLSIHLPKLDTPRENTEVFMIRTDPRHLLVGEMRGRHVFTLNEDQVIRRHQRHLDFLARLNEDRKAERRGQASYSTTGDTPKKRRRHRRNIERACESRCAKHKDFMTDAIHKIACVAVNHAVRRRVFLVTYDGRCKDYTEQFPWSQLESAIRDKLGRHDIAIQTVAGQVGTSDSQDE